MQKHLLRNLLCLLLVIGTLLSLCACPANTPSVTPPDDDKTTTGGTVTPLPPPDDTPVIYGNGAAIPGTGAILSADSLAMTGRPYDAAGAKEIPSTAYFRMAPKGEATVFSVNDGKTVMLQDAAGQTYDGHGTVLIAPQGFIISGAHDILLQNMTLIGSLQIEDSEQVTLQNVEIISEGVFCLSVEAASSSVALENCRLVGNTALILAAGESRVMNSYLAFTEKGIDDLSLTGTTVQNCRLEGSGVAIRSTAAEAVFRENTILLGEQDTGILLPSGAYNGLVAQNVIEGAQTGVSVEAAKNTALIRNSLISVEAKNNHNLYIIDNAMGGRLTATGNDYMIADGNTYPADGKNHTAVQSANTNINGDTVTDVDARLEVGADESLLPHVDKDLFVGMARRETVKDLTLSEELTIEKYMEAMAEAGDVVILQPGAYANEMNFNFTAKHSGTTIYAYGAYMERQKELGRMGDITDVTGMTIKGLTMGFKQQTCGQVYVLEKLPGNILRVVTGAGMMNEFGNTNTMYYNTQGMGAQRMGTFYAYCDTKFISIKKDNSTPVPTMLMSVDHYVFDTTKVGDILTCRAKNGNNTINCTRTEDLSFRDVTLYGNASGMAFCETNTKNGIEYYRVENTTQNGFLIEESLYNAYREMEEKYGVSLEVSVDDLGRYRGSPAHIGSIDATHIITCAEGSQAISCRFENMCDDATNQHSYHSRLAGVEDLGDGTVRLVYKGNLSSVGYDGGSRIPGGHTYHFRKGDRVYAYTGNGQLICDTTALSDGVSLNRTEPNSLLPNGAGIAQYGVIVAAEAVNMAALAEYDLTDDSVTVNKVLLDNMSMASAGFRFENSLFRNIRSRGLLVKASDGVIRNCTFRNIGMSCAAILYEINWGESGVTENMLVDRNLFDHTGYFQNIEKYSPIAINGLGSQVDEDYLLYKNITISNNHVLNRATTYAVYVNSAKNVKIVGNTFGPFVGNDFTDHVEEPETEAKPRPAIRLFGAMDVEIAGNTYSTDAPIEYYVSADQVIHIFGTDVMMDDTPLIPDSQ